MISLLFAGDTDILREATRPSTIFLHRARNSPLRVVIGLAGTVLVVGLLAVLLLGPEGSGIAWLKREWLATTFALIAVGWGAYVGWLVFQFMPSRNDRVVMKWRAMVRRQIDPLEASIRELTDDELRAKRTDFARRLAEGATLDDIRAEAYACVREASRRARDHRQFECQLIGAKVIEDKNVAEMRTGEGKTIVCYCANYLKVIQGLKVHMVTVNDYLVKRDAEFCRPIFELLGCSVGYISSDLPSWNDPERLRQRAYACDITYGTNSEFGFDYLRDNMKMSVRDQVQGKQDFAVVDEVDSILIDEARTPLIISGPAHDDVNNYRIADNIARSLIRKQEAATRDFAKRIDDIEANPPPEWKNEPKFKSGLRKFRADPLWLSSDEAEAIGFLQYYVVELDRKSAHMTEHGAKAAQAELGIGTFYDSKNMNWPHYIDNALRAHVVYQRDKEYVVQDDGIVIVDEFTGRLMQGRQWSDGLHQAVEAKERVTIKQETQTLATITLQNLFKLYRQLAGMTGTAMTEADEFMKIYKLEVIAIPTNKPIRRIDYNDKFYKSVSSKFDAIVEEIHAYSSKGYPADPWSLYDMLREARKFLKASVARPAAADGGDASTAVESIPDAQRKLAVVQEALDLFQDGDGDPAKLEGAYLELAGDRVGGRPLLVGTVAVETSEKLSNLLVRTYGIEHEVLNAKNHAREAEIVAKAGFQHESSRGKKRALCGNVTIATNMAGRGTDIKLGPGVAALGGLHVVGTERHESRRIDNQLRGRCGRQGDPGSSRFFLSFEDDLIKLFMGEWMLRMLNKFALEDGVPIEHKSLTRGIERAQKKVEERNFGIRKNLLEYDEVPDQQRKSFYEMRQRVLEGRNLSEFIWEMINHTVADACDRYYDPQFPAQSVVEWVAQHVGVQIDAGKLDTAEWAVLRDQVRELAVSETRSSVQRTFGEYVDLDVEPDEWDLRGLINWAAGYSLTLTQKQVRESDPADLQEQIVAAATAKVESIDLAPLEEFVNKAYPKQRLIRWAHDKFGVTVDLSEIENAPREEAERIFGEKMREAYRRREVEYPVGAVLDFALQRGGTNANAVYEQVCKWANLKYRVGWTYDHFSGKNPQDIFTELTKLNEEYLRNGRLDGEIDAAIQSHPGEAIVTWARERFGPVVELKPIDPAGDVRDQLKRCGYEMLRYELTQLERMVLLNTFDAVWKDHMYSMDLLRGGINLRAYAERDPKTEFKREGTRLFHELLSNIRERVTDLIFKVHVSVAPASGGDGDGGAGRPSPAAQGESPAFSARATASKADATNVGFSSAARDRDAAMSPQGQAAQPIRRAEPKVGRNAPCPCGSGKKYKQCHGKGKA